MQSVADALQFISYYHPADYIRTPASSTCSSRPASAWPGTRNARCRTPLRASIVADPLFARRNTGDNTPAVVHVAAKGGGSENKAMFEMLNPSDSLVDWVLRTVPGMGAGWCPPGMLGIGAQGLGGLTTVLDVKIRTFGRTCTGNRRRSHDT